MSNLEDVLRQLRGMTPEQRAEVEAAAAEAVGAKKWTPNPGRQTEAYFSKADLLYFGGGAGGSKSDLLLGLAFNEHRRTLLMRRQYTDMRSLIDRSIEINGTRDGFNGSPPPVLRMADGRRVDFGAAAEAGSEETWRGQPHDFIGLDEAEQFLESQVVFLTGWLRSTVPGQRCRVVLASNPPLTSEGEWLIRWFAPWLDRNFPHPAAIGELRWAARLPDGAIAWVDGPEPITPLDGSQWRLATPEEAADPRRHIKPQTRTFILSLLDDNPFLKDTEYRTQLQNLPEPLRSKLLGADYNAGRQDADGQVIPTAWIDAAQARWTPEAPEGAAMTCIGVDVAQGGTAETVLAPRYGHWFATLIAKKGVDTKDGPAVAGLVVSAMRDACAIAIDCDGGWGGSVYDHLRSNLGDQKDRVRAYKGSTYSGGSLTRDRTLRFMNRRAESWWRLREALDPAQRDHPPIALPPDAQLRADLAAPRYEVRPRGLKVEAKTDIIKRLGRSPDRGDAVVMSWSEGERAMRAGLVGHMRGRATPKTVVGYGHMKTRRRH